MFSKSKINDPIEPKSAPKPDAAKPASPAPSTPAPSAPKAPAPKPAPSILSSDLNVKGNMETTGDIQVEGKVEGDIRAHLLTVGESATIKGEVIADDLVVHGRDLVDDLHSLHPPVLRTSAAYAGHLRAQRRQIRGQRQLMLE